MWVVSLRLSSGTREGPRAASRGCSCHRSRACGVDETEGMAPSMGLRLGRSSTESCHSLITERISEEAVLPSF